MDILRVKKAHLPAAPTTSNRKRKVTSAAAVADPENGTQVDVQPVASSSTGAGTIARSMGGTAVVPTMTLGGEKDDEEIEQDAEGSDE